MQLKRTSSTINKRRQLLSLERKAFGILKSVPIFGQIYAGLRAIINFWANATELRFSLAELVNIDNLNPLKTFTSIVRGLVASQFELTEGIWIGKRCLFNETLGIPLPKFSLYPVYDLSHWAILINGRCYQISGTSKINIYCSSSNNWSEIVSFEWFLAYPRNSQRTKQEIDVQGALLCKKGYRLIPNPCVPGINCQLFVIKMLQFAVGWEMEVAHLRTVLSVGTFWW